jgi:hypothetical protein
MICPWKFCVVVLCWQRKPVVGIAFLPSAELFVQQSQKYVCFHFSCFVFFLGCLFYIALVEEEGKKFCIGTHFDPREPSWLAFVSVLAGMILFEKKINATFTSLNHRAEYCILFVSELPHSRCRSQEIFLFPVHQQSFEMNHRKDARGQASSEEPLDSQKRSIQIVR